MSEREQLARALQQEAMDNRPFLYERDPRSGRWGFNQRGTVMNPVWVSCSPFEEDYLNRKHGYKK